MHTLFYIIGFFSLLIFSLSKENKDLYKVLITLTIFVLIIISFSQLIGGDIKHYERYFYGLNANNITLGEWTNDLIKLFFKWASNEMAIEECFRIDMSHLRYQEIPKWNRYVGVCGQGPVAHHGFKLYTIFTNLVFIAGTFSLINSISYHNANVTKFLFLLLPVSMTFFITSIEQALSLGIVFFALSIIQKNILFFIVLIIFASSIHWSSMMFLPLFLYQKRLLWNVFILSLVCVVILEIFNINMISLIFNSFPNNLISSNILQTLKDETERFISWHHIYLSALLVLCAVVFYEHVKDSLDFKDRDDLFLLVSILILLLLVSFIFIGSDLFLVRLGAIIKIISIIFFVNGLYIMNIKYTRQINILLGLNLTLFGIYSFY